MAESKSTSAAPQTATAPAQNILPASHWAEQPLGEADDADSAYGDDTVSSTASLSASILEYRTLHGRTFHSERGSGQSWNPNDNQHDESMDILHHCITLAMGDKLFLAELGDNVHKALDVGCGTGDDFADKYPGAEVIGVDISPQQASWVPPNLRFEVDDVTQPWTWAPGSFDYVHARWLVGSVADWPALFREAFRAIRPGGTFESIESSAMIRSDDDTVAVGSALDQWGRVFWEAGKKFGRSFRVVEDGLQRQAMEAAGFVDIKEIDVKTPLGGWSSDPKQREIGLYGRYALEQDVEGFVVYMWSTVMGWSKEEIQVYAAHLRNELKSGKAHAWFPHKVLIGRKPETT
ncbi:S-adenosyl-L-methionine-dependent methyltransferase [Xylariaceae sp. FL0804]|nr:S-adenosyl-L-methionine-dependent methyltransferase [Xylariaceae sp. FL0804]